jgi:hypothetical protein
MSAYYHLLAPIAISVEDDAHLLKKFKTLYGQDFVHESTERIENFSPLLPNGTRLDFSYTEQTFVLPETLINAEFEAFATVFYTEWQDLYNKKFKGKIYGREIETLDIPKTVSSIKAVLDENDWYSHKTKYAFDDLEPNLFYIERIAPRVVYSGYPLKTDKHTDLSAFSFLHTYGKMGENPDEYAAFVLLLDKIQEKYADQFPFAKYLFIAGY